MSSHWNSPANWWAPRDSERVENGRCEGLARQGLLAGTKIFHRRLYVSFEKIRLTLSNGIRYLFWYLYLYWCWNSSRWLWTKNKDKIYNIYGHRRPPEPPNIGSKRWPFIIGKGAVRAIVANCKICLFFSKMPALQKIFHTYWKTSRKARNSIPEVFEKIPWKKCKTKSAGKRKLSQAEFPQSLVVFAVVCVCLVCCLLVFSEFWRFCT